ncbi:MAG: purine-nucleoside phosphorylase [Acidimicrobiia bacterium]|nr:purine-nucleoside phosphorylase [Acidimicrobiia bacterium]NNL26875.1 purine-nucleoside phosphorylase [Acidimicrobiia bacterium]
MVAVRVIANTTRRKHTLAMVLGSGLGGYGAEDPGAIAMPYLDIPGFPVTKVRGHRGTLFSLKADESENSVLIFSGRAHAYEGLPLHDVVFGVRTAVAAGCTTVVLTNAAGAVSNHLEPGDLALITDHLNLAGMNPLIGGNDERVGPRFPDMTDVYDPGLRSIAEEAALAAGVALKSGVYAWFSGPSYETPAEIEMVRRLGADLVGMSTVPEAIAARHMGAKVLGISLVTNKAAGLSPEPLSHDEVTMSAGLARQDLTMIIDELRKRLM